MRIVSIVVAAVVGAAPASATADQRGDLQANGEQLAKDGRFGEAIEAFKEADRLQPRASHACLIALAYTRRESWPQAELFLSICHQRAREGDPLPDWVPLAEQQIKERLAAANVVEVKIEVKPAGAPARVTVSSFAPDEVFEPRTIHLPIGTHVIFARADGYPNAQQQTIVLADKKPQTIVIDLAAPPAGKPAPVTVPAQKQGTSLLIAGALIGVVGVGTHAWMASERSKMTKTSELWAEHEVRFDIARFTTIGLYTISAGLLLTGYLQRRWSSAESAPAVSAMPLEGGAFVCFGWQR